MNQENKEMTKEFSHSSTKEIVKRENLSTGTTVKVHKNQKMRDEEVRGVIVKLLPNATFKVSTKDGEVFAYVSGKMRKNRIRVLLGDEVILEINKYDKTKGRIMYRFK